MPPKSNSVRSLKRASKGDGRIQGVAFNIDGNNILTPPFLIVDGMEKVRGRPKRNWQNPNSRFRPYECVIMNLGPQIEHEASGSPPPKLRPTPGPIELETTATERHANYPPLQIVLEHYPGTKKPYGEIPLELKRRRKYERRRNSYGIPHGDGCANTESGLSFQFAHEFGFENHYPGGNIGRCTEPTNIPPILSSPSVPRPPLVVYPTPLGGPVHTPASYRYQSQADLDGGFGTHCVALQPVDIAATTWQTHPNSFSFDDAPGESTHPTGLQSAPQYLIHGFPPWDTHILNPPG